MMARLKLCVLTSFLLHLILLISTVGASEHVVVHTSPDSGPGYALAQNGSHHGNDSHRRSHGITIIHINLHEVMGPLIFTIVVLLAGLSKIVFHHADFLSSRVPESCVLIVLGTVFGAIIHFTKLSNELPTFFDPHQFFIFLLPPIILESAYSLYDRTFSENIGSVLLFAVVGTVLACFLLGLTVKGLIVIGAMGAIPNMGLAEVFVFSSLIVAVDPVAVLAVFNEVGVNHVLYFLVFGESLLNDGVTVVLYKVMQTYNLMPVITPDQIILGIVKFFVVCLGGLLIGILSGIGTAFLTKQTQYVGVVQPLVIYAMAYLGFLVSEVFEVSGIISIIGCGLLQRHYAYHNISHKSRITVKYFTKVLSSANEIIIFLFLGLSLVNDEHDWHTGFVGWVLLLCLIYRFMIVFSLAALINRFDTVRVRRIGWDEMFMIAYGGLRGAVAFSLAALLDEEDLPRKRLFVTTTLATVVFTVFIQGISIKPLVQLLSIKLAPEKNRSMYCELNSHVTDHLMAGIEDIVGMRGRNHLREKIDMLDSAYMKKWLVIDPDPTDVDLHAFYTKIVVKEHYNYLKVCGVKSVPDDSLIPHVDTSMYLNTMDRGEDLHEDNDIKDKVGDKGAANSDTLLLRPKRTTTTFPASIMNRRRGRGKSISEDINDAKALRSLLINQRSSRLLLHTNYDKNLTTEDQNNIVHEIQKKSAKNRRLKHLMTVSMSKEEDAAVRRASWAGDQISQARNTSKLTAEERRASTKRSHTVDLGSATRMGTFDPLASATGSPSSPSSTLDTVFEDDNSNLNGNNLEHTEQRMEEDFSPLIDNESQPIVRVAMGRQSTASRHRLQRQDDIKLSDIKGTSNDSGDVFPA